MSLENEFAKVPRGNKNYQRFVICYRKPAIFSSQFEYYIACEHNQYSTKEIAGNKRFQQLVSTCFLCPVCPSIYSEHYHQETRKCNQLCTPERIVFQPPIPIQEDSTHDCTRHYIQIRQTIIPSYVTHDYSPHFTTKHSWRYALTIIHGATCFPPPLPKLPRTEPRIPRRMRERAPREKRKRKRRKRKTKIFGQCDPHFESSICNNGEGSSKDDTHQSLLANNDPDSQANH